MRTFHEKIDDIRGNLVTVSGSKAKLGELARIEMADGRKAYASVLKIDGDKVKFSVIGYGHGVGMSQTGADAMAKQGASYTEIINHFYTGIEIVDI